jgi:hypothetical protein
VSNTGTGPDQEYHMRLTSAITGVLAIGAIADGAQGQSAMVHCTRRSPIVATADTASVTDGSHFSPDSIAMPCPDGARSSRIESMAPSLLRVASGIGIAAAVAQVSNAPEQWPQTGAGLLQRLADQSGAVAIQALTYHAISQRLAWQPSHSPCPPGVLARPQCALAKALIVRNPQGAPRPDLARITSLALGSAGSLLWRPERHSRDGAALFVLTRVGTGLAFAALRHAVARERPPAPR